MLTIKHGEGLRHLSPDGHNLRQLGCRECSLITIRVIGLPNDGAAAAPAAVGDTACISIAQGGLEAAKEGLGAEWGDAAAGWALHLRRGTATGLL